jgi:hypothetical protein
MDEPRQPVRDALAEVIAARARKHFRPSADDLIALHEGGLSEEEAERVLDYLALHPDEAQAVAAFDEDDFALPQPGEVELSEAELEARLVALKKQAAVVGPPAPLAAVAEAPKAPEAPPAPAAAPLRPKTFRWQKVAAVVGWMVVGGFGSYLVSRPDVSQPVTEIPLASAEEGTTRSASEGHSVFSDLVSLELRFLNETGFSRFRLEMRTIGGTTDSSYETREMTVPGGCKPQEECSLAVSFRADLLVGKVWRFELLGVDDGKPVLVKAFEGRFRDARP